MTRMRSIWNRLLNFQASVIDNYAFRLHYKLTLPILLVLSVVIAVRQNFGRSINCWTMEDIPKDFVNDFCYGHSTFIIAEGWEKELGVEVPHPGISKYSPNETRIYHYYYKWVSLVLFLQAMLFGVPRYFWKAMESGRIHDMVSEFKKLSETHERNFQGLANEVIADFNYNGGYCFLYLAAEVLNVLNVFGQVCLMNAFLGGEFLSYGPQMLRNMNDVRTESSYSMNRVFPRMALCVLNRYARSGDVQTHRILCQIPINILYEKLYLFLWFWFIVLAILSCLALMYRLLILISRKFRLSILMLRTRPDVRGSLRALLEDRNAGDWFVIYLLSKNLKPSYFQQFVLALTDKTECIELNVLTNNGQTS